MDQLFLMQRYWGSDEEDNKEENSFKFNSLEKSDTLTEKQSIPVIDIDDDDYMVSNKKQKINSNSEIKNKRNKTHRQKTDPSDSDIEIVSDSLDDVSSKKVLNGTSEPFELKIIAVKQKSKDAKLEKKHSKKLSEENDLRSLEVNHDYSIENARSNKHKLEIIGVDVENTAKKRKKKKLKLPKEENDCYEDIPEQYLDREIDTNEGKKQKRGFRYFNFEENNDKSISEDNKLNTKIDNIFTRKNKVTENLLQGTNDVDSEINSKKEKKQRIKLKEELEDEIDANKGRKQEQGLRYFNFEKNNASISAEDNIITPKEKITKTININKSKNNKKSKIMSKVDESDVDIDNVLENEAKSQNVENVGEAFSTIGQVYTQKNERVKHSLPQWLSNPTYISVNLQEKEIPISELSYLDLNTKNNLIKAGINFLFPVQLAVIPWLMQSKEQSLLIRPSDICVSAPTGSGKTLAFVLPIVQSLKDRVVCAIRALIVLPVTELAIQVYKVFQTYTQGTDLKVALLTGKKSFIDEQNYLVKHTGQSVQSLIDIVVGTPGRIYDHIYRTQGFCLKRLRYLVIDEADRMMEEIQQGWLKQVEDAVFHDCISPNCVCSSYKRTFFEPTCAYNFGFISQSLQKLLYSATLTHDPEQLHTLSLYKPKLFTASSVYINNEYKVSCAIPPGIKMFQVICEEGVKPMVICHLIKLHNFKRVLCFTETVERAHRLNLVLEGMGLFQVREISSFNRPTQRKIVLDQFRSGKINILVCSDLVARGIDIQDIDCVMSYDIPENDKIFTHRVGRTARAGKTGTALALLSEGEIPRFKKMLSVNPAIKLPEKVYINFEDLKPLVKSFQAALPVADAKIKKEKNQAPVKSSKKNKRK